MKSEIEARDPKQIQMLKNLKLTGKWPRNSNANKNGCSSPWL
jgi:hypothetical protein